MYFEEGSSGKPAFDTYIVFRIINRGSGHLNGLAHLIGLVKSLKCLKLKTHKSIVRLSDRLRHSSDDSDISRHVTIC